MSWISWNNIITYVYTKTVRRGCVTKFRRPYCGTKIQSFERCMGTQPWAERMSYFVEKVGIYHGKTRITASWWHVINSTRALKSSEAIMVQRLMVSWQRCLSLFDSRSPECRKDINSLATEVLVASRIFTLGWKRKPNRLGNCGSWYIRVT